MPVISSNKRLAKSPILPVPISIFSPLCSINPTGEITAAVPEPNTSFSDPFFEASKTSEIEILRSSTLRPHSSASAVTDFLVIPVVQTLKVPE